MPNQDVRTKIERAIEKMPQWLRHDLAAADPALRERAHEALAASILAVIEKAAAEK